MLSKTVKFIYTHRENCLSWQENLFHSELRNLYYIKVFTNNLTTNLHTYIYFILIAIFWTYHLYWGELKQCFGRSILWPSLGVPCFSGHRNDSTREIIFKVWLLIKQDVQKPWKSYSNNDIIVFYAYQSKKHQKKFHKMNSKHKIQWHQLFLIFFKVIYFKNNFIWPFQLLVPQIVFISILGLLKRST